MPARPGLLKRDEEAVRLLMGKAGNSIYAGVINTQLKRQFSADELDPFMAKARVIVDDPSKLRAEISDGHQILATEISKVLNEATKEIIIFTAYFIPGKNGIEFVRRMRDKGVKVLVLTNSLASNTHTAVHSAYSSYRKDLLEAGVELGETRANAAEITVAPDNTKLKKSSHCIPRVS